MISRFVKTNQSLEFAVLFLFALVFTIGVLVKRDYVSEIESRGGRVTRVSRHSSTARWLDRFGLSDAGSWFDRVYRNSGAVVGVNFLGSGITDEGLVYLEGLTRLENLNLRDTDTTALTGIDPGVLGKSDPVGESGDGGFFLPSRREFFRAGGGWVG